MPKSPAKEIVDKRYRDLREQFWPGQPSWRGACPAEKGGWFAIPRSLPLFLSIISDLVKDKKKGNPTLAYLDLLGTHREGVVEVKNERDHAFASGYSGSRAIQTWREQIILLRDLGLIGTVEYNDLTHGVIKLNHPTVAIRKLHDARPDLFPKGWWNTYVVRQKRAGERPYEEIVEEGPKTEKV